MINWIDVKDRLPQEYDSVVFAWEWEEGRPLQYGAGDYLDGGFYIDHGDIAAGPYKSVKFWYPLNEPGGDKDD